MKDNEEKTIKDSSTKIFQEIEDSKNKLLGDDELSDDEFVNGLESLMDKIMNVIKRKKNHEKEE